MILLGEFDASLRTKSISTKVTDEEHAQFEALAGGFLRYKGAAVYNHFMAKDVIHISETEAASDFASLMARVRAGAEIVIENGERPVAVLHAAEPVRRSISECIALAKAHEEETGKAPVLDPDFAEDVEEILTHRKPWNPPAWE